METVAKAMGFLSSLGVGASADWVPSEFEREDSIVFGKRIEERRTEIIDTE